MRLARRLPALGLAPIARLAAQPKALAVANGLPGRRLRAFIARLRRDFGAPVPEPVIR